MEKSLSLHSDEYNRLNQFYDQPVLLGKKSDTERIKYPRILVALVSIVVSFQ